jgi:enterochelin esterase-like enzyme
MTESRSTPGLRPESPAARGTLDSVVLPSRVLERCNPLGDPTDRRTWIWLPPGYERGDRSYPTLWCLPAYTSSGPAQVAWRNHGENLPQRLDRLVSTSAMPPAIVVMPDSFTSLGGNQFVDTPAMGRYASYLVDELLPEVERRYRCVPDAGGRGVFGKSSGGFGALHLVTRFPGVFGAAASHAGDCGFDRVYVRDFTSCCDELAQWDQNLESFVAGFWRLRRPSGRGFHALMTLCLAASYSPAPGRPLNLALPFDLETAKVDPAVWERWLSFDPVRFDDRAFECLAALDALWLDAGSRDQYFIQYGTRELAARLRRAGIEHRHEEFDGTHSGLDWRLDRSLPWLLSRLPGAGG